MPFPLAALLLTLGGPQPFNVSGSVEAVTAPAAIGASRWVAQRQGAALAPSLQGKPVVVDIYASLPGVNYVGGSRQLRRRVTPGPPPAMAGGGDSEK